MSYRGKPSPPVKPRHIEFPEMVEAIIEKLHESDMPARMKAEIAISMASVHETEGRLFDAVIGYETAAFFYPRAAVLSPLRSLRQRLSSAR